MFVGVYICVCVHACVCERARVCVSACMCARICSCVCVRARLCLSLCVPVYQGVAYPRVLTIQIGIRISLGICQSPTMRMRNCSSGPGICLCPEVTAISCAVLGLFNDVLVGMYLRVYVGVGVGVGARARVCACVCVCVCVCVCQA
jgi:hypothetical protein